MMPDTTRIFLTGYMGAGKSTIGSLLAQQCGYQFYDTDRMLIRGFGNRSISRIFEELGETRFREAEDQVIAAFAKRGNVVVSTGGGTLVRESTLKPALAMGTVVYLRAPIEVLYERVIFSPKDRPILNQAETEQVFREKFAAREAFYNQAHLTIDTVDTTRNNEPIPRQQVIDTLMQALGLPKAVSP